MDAIDLEKEKAAHTPVDEVDKAKVPNNPVVHQQPQPRVQMCPTCAGSSRNVRCLPSDSTGRRSWSFGLMECGDDINTCCLAFWCPCVVDAQNRRRLDYLNANGAADPNRRKFFTHDTVVITLIEAIWEVGWILQIATRNSIRQRYRIRGGPWTDCLTPLLCQSCELVQGSRELELEEEALLARARESS